MVQLFFLLYSSAQGSSLRSSPLLSTSLSAGRGARRVEISTEKGGLVQTLVMCSLSHFRTTYIVICQKYCYGVMRNILSYQNKSKIGQRQKISSFMKSSNKLCYGEAVVYRKIPSHHFSLAVLTILLICSTASPKLVAWNPDVL